MLRIQALEQQTITSYQSYVLYNIESVPHCICQQDEIGLPINSPEVTGVSGECYGQCQWLDLRIESSAITASYILKLFTFLSNSG